MIIFGAELDGGECGIDFDQILLGQRQLTEEFRLIGAEGRLVRGERNEPFVDEEEAKTCPRQLKSRKNQNQQIDQRTTGQTNADQQLLLHQFSNDFFQLSGEFLRQLLVAIGDVNVARRHLEKRENLSRLSFIRRVFRKEVFSSVDKSRISVQRSEDNRSPTERDEIEPTPTVPTSDGGEQSNDRSNGKAHP